ncbi:HAD hydrolase-like protein [Halobacillus sp. Marseille-Q1614]|uniref:HAD hydrolase-like protein n=1 Tax=Halobacillus sp. Marseille-Q1614 TaxID=2709134 RepID=UPI001571140D|nr:HAD hydrolase-like protein [Halobacillus sp. Marseille-Q1614]
MSRTVIFDMDGTLFQTNTILEISLEDTFNHLRSNGQWEGETPIEKYREIMGVPLVTVWKSLLPDHSEEIRHEADEYFLDQLIANINKGNGELYPHAIEMLNSLKEKGYSIFIASNGLPQYLEAIVTYYSLDQWVKETFSIQSIPTLDKGDLVKSILVKYEKENAVVVGDRLSDIHAAKTNHLMAVGCNFDFAVEDELAQADKVIDDLIQLQTVLDGQLAERSRRA